MQSYMPYLYTILALSLIVAAFMFTAIGGVIRAGIGNLVVVFVKAIMAFVVMLVAFHVIVWISTIGTAIYLLNVSTHFSRQAPQLQAEHQAYMQQQYWPQMRQHECNQCKQYEFTHFNKSARESEAACLKYCEPSEN
jgi:hypothetical protein